MKINCMKFLRICTECGLPILFGEYCIPHLAGSLHKRCATRLKMNALVVDEFVRKQYTAAETEVMNVSEN